MSMYFVTENGYDFAIYAADSAVDAVTEAIVETYGSLEDITDEIFTVYQAMPQARKFGIKTNPIIQEVT